MSSSTRAINISLFSGKPLPSPIPEIAFCMRRARAAQTGLQLLLNPASDRPLSPVPAWWRCPLVRHGCPTALFNILLQFQ
jgi:hypothetical protein